ncbi:MAG: FAD-binding protein [Candidatus Hydrogenedentes bacterium]|nr:FAD-binding protein [Candidatus Hydrogenedentota bacterium]
MNTSQQRAVVHGAKCEVRFDALTRRLYATDASLYQIEPLGVAFPRNAEEASSAIQAAAEAGMPVIPRGAGTGLCGGAVGEALIIDFSRHNRQISPLDFDRMTVRVGSGVVLDQLNGYLKLHGLCFGPDVATSSRATLGGMIANNSSGARVPRYGTTSDHVVSLDLVLADGRIAKVGNGDGIMAEYQQRVDAIVRGVEAAVAERMPPGLLKRWPGYAFDRYLRGNGNLVQLFAGSEGTLAGISSAELKVVPLPREKGVGLLYFASVMEAMQASVELADLKPVAIEHIDRVLFDQTRGQLPFAAARRLLRLDEEPCEAILIVEFYEDIAERLDALPRRKLGLRNSIHTDAHEMELIWNLRKAGLSLLTGCKGSKKPVVGIEDVAVRPEQLPAYVEGLMGLMTPLGLEASYYGHAASGLLHVRPVLDLHTAEDMAKYRKLGDDVSALVKQFKGSLAAEHGVGISQTEFVADHLGPELMAAMREIKTLFDPNNLLNPGKLIDDGRYHFDAQMRSSAGYKLELPFTPVLAFAAKDDSFIGNLEQCNGCGGCRKDAPTMCPTFAATGDEIMSTRGRANTIRAALEGRFADQGPDPLLLAELDEALSNCLSCKACTTECPSNVNMALLKSELLHAKHQRHGVKLSEWLVSNVDLMGRLGCIVPGVANAMLTWEWLRKQMEKHAGLAAKRPLPPYTKQRFDTWFTKRSQRGGATRGRVILWDDTFVRYHEPHIGIAAVKVLEAAGFEVALLKGRACCGRPAFSQGRLDMAARFGKRNLGLLAAAGGNDPILFLEPSCLSMFSEDYRELSVPGAAGVAKRCFQFEQFIFDLLEREPDALKFQDGYSHVAIHAHCHAKALTNTAYMTKLAQRLPNSEVTMLDTGCCGMAGAFGAMESKYDLSLKVARPLVDKINHLQAGSHVVASGTSCRHQIDHLTDAAPIHMAELLAEALERGSVWSV